MARELIEDLYLVLMERGSASNGLLPNGQAQSDGSSNVFNAIKRSIFGNFEIGNLMQGFLPFGRKSSSSEASTPDEGGIEMACFAESELSLKGHEFFRQHLTNPTWCDECGDFIYGLYKQCLRCRYCQFTCHRQCGPLVRLGCKASPTDEGVPPDPPSVETSITTTTTEPSESHNTTQEGGSEATNEKDETDSGYRSGTIPDEKLPHKPSQATLNREELRKKIEEYNNIMPKAEICLKDDKSESFQGFIKVALNLVRPICMSLGARPPSIYEMLTKEHIVEQNTLTISFYMPRDTVKSIHITSEISTKEVISMLLKKFQILDHPRKFALYEQELSLKGKIVKLRRLPDTECPLLTCLNMDKEKVYCTRLVLQENETGEIVWDNFSEPELNNFLKVLLREEKEYTSQIEYKYTVMKRLINQRLKELRKEKHAKDMEKRKSAILESPTQS